MYSINRVDLIFYRVTYELEQNTYTDTNTDDTVILKVEKLRETNRQPS